MTNTNFNSICQQNCTICNHPLLKEIHNLKRDGINQKEIVKKINDKSKRKISEASLCRHFKNTKEVINAEIQKQEIELLKKEATDILTYQKWTNQLLTRSFQKIWARFDDMQLDMSDLERLLKMRILLKEGESGVGDNIIDVFDKAAKKYGVNYDQAKLFETEPKDPLKNAIEVQANEA